MPDPAHVRTDETIKELERKVSKEYNKARKESQAKLDAYFKRFNEEDAIKRKLLNAGEITKKDYQDWRLRKLGMGKRWEDIRDNLAQDYHNTNEIAKSIANGYKADVYALNHNYATYQIEHDGGIDTFYSLYDRQTVERLMREDQQLMPPPGKKVRRAIAEGRDVAWNNKQIQSALTQAILQGETVSQFADRISRTVSTRNRDASIRYARTMMTSAQNAGRYDAYRRADKMGINLTIEWAATLDERTRHNHRIMHGQRTTVDEPFHTPDGYEIYYPADSTGISDAPQNEIWNCRCTLLAWVKGYESDAVKDSPKMGDMSFDEWLEAKPHPDTKEDREQYAEYKKLLGKKAPSSYRAFRDMKYNNAEEWAEAKKKARKKRSGK